MNFDLRVEIMFMTLTMYLRNKVPEQIYLESKKAICWVKDLVLSRYVFGKSASSLKRMALWEQMLGPGRLSAKIINVSRKRIYKKIYKKTMFHAQRVVKEVSY